METRTEEENQPVTVVISQLVKPGKERAFEQWLTGICSAAKSFSGHLGTNIIRPPQRTHSEYVIIFKFDHYRSLQTWMNSKERQQWIIKALPLIQGAPNVQELSGLEAWFSLPGRLLNLPPPRYKTAILVWASISVLTNTLAPLFSYALRGFPTLVTSVIISAIVTTLMTYVVMPQVTQVFSKWLYPEG
ncbi:antibiotic biosynthesis monooxygenase [Oscillatoria sp. FACHB-1407]|uniref:antibiotic biosynthesis monooxygenase n=1 Tax=Oscillatoria sp. FACHB-1407 TaxID=2692847 RepID=UPI001685FBBB|nr:antibiotic biosynthesis monooxygenase [Oscillatoria sp. FACHB-1407]MBD2465936.1 antibiotic biosynthesis monooxygenase [Oscillatoria sp. FACHB-1407]